MRLRVPRVVFASGGALRLLDGVQATVRHRGLATDAPVYAAETGAAVLSSTATVVAGDFPGYLEEGSYDAVGSFGTVPFEVVAGGGGARRLKSARRETNYAAADGFTAAAGTHDIPTMSVTFQAGVRPFVVKLLGWTYRIEGAAGTIALTLRDVTRAKDVQIGGGAAALNALSLWPTIEAPIDDAVPGTVYEYRARVSATGSGVTGGTIFASANAPLMLEAVER